MTLHVIAVCGKSLFARLSKIPKYLIFDDRAGGPLLNQFPEV